MWANPNSSSCCSELALLRSLLIESLHRALCALDCAGNFHAMPAGADASRFDVFQTCFYFHERPLPRDPVDPVGSRWSPRPHVARPNSKGSPARGLRRLLSRFGAAASLKIVEARTKTCWVPGFRADCVDCIDCVGICWGLRASRRIAAQLAAIARDCAHFKIKPQRFLSAPNKNARGRPEALKELPEFRLGSNV